MLQVRLVQGCSTGLGAGGAEEGLDEASGMSSMPDEMR